MRIEMEDPNKKKAASESEAFTPVQDEKRTLKSEWQKMKSMGLKEGWNYFLDYYRNTVIIAVIVILCVASLVTTVIRNKRPYVIEINIYNNYIEDDTDIDAFQEAFAEHMGVNLKDYQMLFNATDYFNPDQASEEMTATLYKFAAMIASGELDIIGGDRTFVDYYSTGEEETVYFTDLETILPDDLLQKLKAEDRIYYSNYLDEDGNVVGQYASAIEVSSTRLTEEAGLLVTPCYIGIVPNTNRLDTSIEFLYWIFYMTE